MNQSEATVRPRRNLLAAIGATAITLWSAPKLLASTKAAKTAVSAVDKYAFTILIGRLCVDRTFRDEFLGSKNAEAALALLKKDHMPSSIIENDWVAAIFKDRKYLMKLEDACKGVEQAATVPKMEKTKLPPPCDPWPC